MYAQLLSCFNGYCLAHSTDSLRLAESGVIEDWLDHLRASVAASRYEYPEQTTPLSQPSLGLVTITHPFHPLRGQQVEVVNIRRGRDPDLIIRLPNGTHAAVAMSLTNYAPTPDIELPPDPPPLLDIDGLRQVVQFIDRLRQEGRYPTRDGQASCPAPESGYD